ncbi:MAG TPA: hypothetical protein VHG30_02110 [Microvirga sp.]|nr:hypothetical protein [Microvirga sp.]
MALTGRFTFRRSFWGRIVLQVEEEKRSLWSRSKPFKKRWRDATLMDLAAPELRALIDLRYKPHFMAQHEYLGSDASSQQAPADAAAQEGIAVPLLDPKRGRRPQPIQQDVSVELERAQRLHELRTNGNRPS